MTTTELKLVALIFMFIDHIAEFNSTVPQWFHWIGRLSAPIFFFCTAWGFFYTSNRKKYLIRMYLCSIGMSVVNLIINTFFNDKHNNYINNNIFLTLFLCCMIIYIIDIFKSHPEKGKFYITIFCVLQLFSTSIIIYNDYIGCSYVSSELLTSIFTNIFACEGGIPFVILGILLYYNKNNKFKLAISYCIFCLFYIIFYVTNIMARILIKLECIFPYIIYKIISITVQILGMDIIPIYNTRFYSLTTCYWMIIFALPLILTYNGNKGKGYKYFFYIFYPAHIYILYFINDIMSK